MGVSVELKDSYVVKYLQGSYMEVGINIFIRSLRRSIASRCIRNLVCVRQCILTHHTNYLLLPVILVIRLSPIGFESSVLSFNVVMRLGCYKCEMRVIVEESHTSDLLIVDTMCRTQTKSRD